METDTSPRRWPWAVLLATTLALGCTRVVPDTDGPVADQALPLDLGKWRSNQLYCRTGDCRDWYRITLPDRGDLRIDAVASQDASRSFRLTLHDSGNVALSQASSAGSGRAQVFETTGRGVYLIEVATPSDRTRAPLAYEIQARFKPEPKAPPAPPPPDLVQADVIEIEGAGEPEAVLVDKGRDAGISVGLPGRLMEGDEEIGRVQVQDVYPEGSRLRIDGSLSAPITHTTKAVIEVPAGTLSGEGRP